MTMELVCKRFEELTLGELYEILRCRCEVFAMEQKILYQDMDGKDMTSTHLFYTVEGRIVSYLRIIDAGVKYPEVSIGRVLTLKDYRHRGISRRLMEEAIAHIRSRTDAPIRIEAQSYLKEFYESIGFRAVSGEFILEGIPHISMLYS